MLWSAPAGELLQREGIGWGAFEYRLDFGPGYRIYFGKDGDRMLILLAGGTKKGQQRDIAKAAALWRDYKRRKLKGGEQK